MDKESMSSVQKWLGVNAMKMLRALVTSRVLFKLSMAVPTQNSMRNPTSRSGHHPNPS
ncbi:hypothetical protein [Pantoea ananatis]|uniref:hypothetical protein n=1 Tax=Pantoea ananas TaxID=553 RepID=UPI001B306699|nr:hypothetical protein [Pantoea ananatis]